MTRDNPQAAPEKDDFRQRCQSSTALSHLQRPTHTRRSPCSGRHGEGKRAFENPILGGTYAPGYYPRGINASGGTINLTAGRYFLGAPGIELNGSAAVIAAPGSTIFLLARNAPLGLTANAGIRLRGSGSVTVTPPTGPAAGVYNGIAIFMERGNSAKVDAGGTGSLDLKGFLYCPDGILDLGGTQNYSIGGINVLEMKSLGSGFVTGINVPPGSGPPSVYLVE